jgi:hypothetical protein
MMPVYVYASERLNARVALLVTFELMDPVLLPEPMDSVPALTVVIPV